MKLDNLDIPTGPTTSPRPPPWTEADAKELRAVKLRAAELEVKHQIACKFAMRPLIEWFGKRANLFDGSQSPADLAEMFANHSCNLIPMLEPFKDGNLRP